MDTRLVILRSKVVQLIRRFFDDHGFTEMLTPRLVGLPGQEPYLEPFWTTVRCPNVKIQNPKSKILDSGSQIPAALITSPEYAMKRLLAAGLDKIYDLGPCFRNDEPWDGTHDPEFLLLEWYRRDAGLEELMNDTEEMIRWVTEQIQNPKSKIQNFGPFRRLTVSEALKQYANVDLEPLLEDRGALAEVVRQHGQTVNDEDTWDDLFFKIFLSEVEPKLGWSDPPPAGGGVRGGGREARPTFLTRYPASMAALARRSADDPRYADRVELYIGDLELANGFAELADPAEQRQRFLDDRALRQKLGKKTWPLDERFLSALPAMGQAAGIAFGVDRLVMLLTGAKSINEVLPFPARERFVAEEELPFDQPGDKS